MIDEIIAFQNRIWFQWSCAHYREVLEFYSDPVYRRRRLKSYMEKQREVDRACRLIVTKTQLQMADQKTTIPLVERWVRNDQGNRVRKKYHDSSLIVAFGSCNVNAIQNISGASGPVLRIRSRLAHYVKSLQQTNEAFTSCRCLKCSLDLIKCNPDAPPQGRTVLSKMINPEVTTIVKKNGTETSKKATPFKVLLCTECGQYWNRDVNGSGQIRECYLYQVKQGVRPWTLRRFPSAKDTQERDLPGSTGATNLQLQLHQNGHLL